MIRLQRAMWHALAYDQLPDKKTPFTNFFASLPTLNVGVSSGIISM